MVKKEMVYSMQIPHDFSARDTNMRNFGSPEYRAYWGVNQSERVLRERLVKEFSLQEKSLPFEKTEFIGFGGSCMYVFSFNSRGNLGPNIDVGVGYDARPMDENCRSLSVDALGKPPSYGLQVILEKSGDLENLDRQSDFERELIRLGFSLEERQAA